VGKRVAIVLTIVLISSLAVMIYYLQQGRKSMFTDPYIAIPADASFLIESVDIKSFLNSLTTGQGLPGEIAKISELANFNLKLKTLTDQINKKGMTEILGEGSSLLSFHAVRNGKVKVLFAKALPGNTHLRQGKEAIRSSIGDLVLSDKTDDKLLFVPFRSGSTSDTVWISVESGLALCSNAKELLIKSKEQTKSGSDIRNHPGFSRVLLASGKNEDKIFIIFSNLKSILGSLVVDKASSLVKSVTALARTAEGDIFMNDDGLVLSGYTESTDPSDILYRFRDLVPETFQTYKILPSSTILFETVIPPEKINLPGSDTSISKLASEVAAKLIPFICNEVTRALINIRERPTADNVLLVYKLNNREQAENAFLEQLPSNGSVLYFQPDDQVKMAVYQISLKGLKEMITPGFSHDACESFFTFYDNYLISGSSYVTISRFLYDNLLNKTLANDLTYRDFEGTLPSRSCYFFYCVPSALTGYFEGMLNDKIVAALKSNAGSLKKVSSAGYQLASSNGMIYNSLSIRFKEAGREESTTEWETLLDTVAAIKPFFFTNHITGAKEIFIQDLKNNIYLINAAGRVLWKVPLSERINGSVYMIDYFRNGKYQLLFSGKNFLHLVDRNGNYVERYPVRLRSPASNSLALFDYDNNQNYRLFIAGEDKLIYVYDKSGNVVKDWKTYHTSGIVTSEITFTRISGKDYIIVADETSIAFLDRTGRKRVNLKEAVVKASGSSIRVVSGNNPYIVCSAPDGTIQQIGFDGKVTKFVIQPFSGDHSFDFFDIDGDGFGEYIFIDKGILYLYDHNRSEMFIRNFGSADLGGPINFVFSGTNRKIGVFDINKKLIYLIDVDGKTMSGFPLRGASMFSIGKLSEKSGWHLIVGGTDRFLYNYKLEDI